MKGRISANAARSGLCVIFSVYLAVGNCEENGFAKWADAHARPITTIDSHGLSIGLEDRYLENRELIQWMRDYNATVSSAGQHKIHLYGIDLPFGARVGGARRSINSALTFLSRADPVAAQRVRNSTSGTT